MIKPTHRECSNCGEVKPYTAEFFRTMNGEVHGRQCRVCMNARGKDYTRRYRANGSKKMGRPKPPTEKTCTECGETFPFTLEFFRDSSADSSKPTGNRCRSCQSKADYKKVLENCGKDEGYAEKYVSRKRKNSQVKLAKHRKKMSSDPEYARHCKERDRACKQRHCDLVTDEYVRGLLASRSPLKGKDFPQEIVDAHRYLLKLKRIISEKQDVETQNQ